MPALPRETKMKPKVVQICDAGDVHNDRLRTISERVIQLFALDAHKCCLNTAA
jgi:hypothetical protein